MNPANREISLHPWFANRLKPKTPVANDADFHFAMGCNGYFLEKGQWQFQADTPRRILEDFKAQKISFFGPGSSEQFFSDKKIDYQKYLPLGQQSVTDVIREYRQVDESQAVRIAFLFGGLIRQLSSHNITTSDISNALRFTSRMTRLGERESAEAITSSVAMYILSGGLIDHESHFAVRVNQMAKAVREDPIVPKQTADLGLSQLARLSAFWRKVQGKGYKHFPDLKQYIASFDGFPTVGAEFHFPSNTPAKKPNFWQRLAIFNISQYHKDSYIQLSRNDRDVIEVRMNPSIYPITIANWNYLRLFMPELNEAFFTITLNRPGKEGDFNWENDPDRALLGKLQSLGMLCFANLFENIPHTQKKKDIDFGTSYLGQTVTIQNGDYKFSGNWSGGEGKHGQLGIYTGFGENFNHLTYYLSMALAKPEVFKSIDLHVLSRSKTLQGAFATPAADRRAVFGSIQRQIFSDRGLTTAYQSGNRIMELLNP